MIAIGKTYGLRRIRIPAEPPGVMKRCGERAGFSDHALYGWSKILKIQARGLAHHDHVFGLKWSGHMTLPRVQKLLRHLPVGSSEIYFHPATVSDAALAALMPGYEHAGEMQTLLDLRQSSDAITRQPA
jgi:hypothetical protein